MQLISLRIGIESEEKRESISSIIGLTPNMPSKYGFWGFEINDEKSEITSPIEFFYGKMANKMKELETVGVTNDDISVWVFYEYDQQCNLEFTPEEVNNLNEMGVALCISCWQK